MDRERARSTDGCAEARRREIGARDAFDWDRFVGEQGDRLRRIVRGVARSRRGGVTEEGVDDLFQETLLRMLQCRRFHRHVARHCQAELESYFRQTVRTVVLDDWRRRAAAKRCAEEWVPESLADCCRDSSPSPEQRVLAVERQGVLRERLQAALPESCSKRDRELLDRVVFEGARPCDLAAAPRAGFSPGAAYVALHRMRRALRERGREKLLH